MYQVSREIHFCYGHRLLNYDGKCRHLHGHNGKVVISLQAEGLDSLGMVMDFSRIKQVLTTWIDETLDHRMLLHQDDPVLSYLRKQGEPVYVMQVNPTAENIARLIYEYARSQGFPVSEVQLWETESCYAAYSVEPGHAVDD